MVCWRIIKSTCTSTPLSLCHFWWADEEHSEECNWRHPFVTLARVRGAIASSIRDGGMSAPWGRERQREGWWMGEGWMEGWEDGGTAICLCVLTHCPPQRPSAQIRRSDTPPNCNTWVFVCVFVCGKQQSLHTEIRRSWGSTWQDFYGKFVLSY